MRIAVGSKNPTKIEAARQAFAAMFPGETIDIMGIEVESGVSAQPMSDEETIHGGRNRAQNALKKTGADYGVGMEGGIQELQGRIMSCGWMIVINKDGREGIGGNPKVEIAPKIMKLIREGKELGDALDQFFNRKDVKKAEGYFGIITKNNITRTSGYRDGVIMALAPFAHPDLFSAEGGSSSGGKEV